MRNAPDFIARIKILSTGEGGRAGPTPAEAHNCMMVLGDRNFDVKLHLHQTGALHPGQEATVPISFLDPDLARKYISVGQVFDLRELRIVASGVVEEIMSF